MIRPLSNHFLIILYYRRKDKLIVASLGRESCIRTFTLPPIQTVASSCVPISLVGICCKKFKNYSGLFNELNQSKTMHQCPLENTDPRLQAKRRLGYVGIFSGGQLHSVAKILVLFLGKLMFQEQQRNGCYHWHHFGSFAIRAKKVKEYLASTIIL